jgi:hypothetical protein
MEIFLVCGSDRKKNISKAANFLCRVYKNKIKPRNIFIYSMKEEHGNANNIRNIIKNRVIYHPASLKNKLSESLENTKKNNGNQRQVFIASLEEIKNMLNSISSRCRLDKSCFKIKEGSIISIPLNGRRMATAKKIFTP